MKKLLLISACLVALAACQREEIKELITVSFEVSDVEADASKATYDSQAHKVAWEYGDEIGCFAEMNNNIKFSNSQNAPTSFTGSVWDTPSEYFFYHPFTPGVTANGTVVTTTYPAEQTLRANDFAAAPLMVATSKNLSAGVNFHNACGLVRFTVTTDEARKLVSAEFSGNNDELIAGTCTVDMASSTPSAKIASGGSSKITMKGEVFMQEGGSYSFILALPPTSFSGGITIRLKDENNMVLNKTFDKPLDLGRNKAINIDTPLEFTAANAEPELQLQLTSLSIANPAVAFVIDESTMTATATRSEFTTPTNLTLNMNYAASQDGASVTPTITLNSLGDLAGKTISTSTKTVSGVNLSMPRTITLAYGEVTKEYKVKFSQLSDSGLPVVYVNTPGAQSITSKDNWLPAEPEDDQADGYYTYIYIDGDNRSSWDGKAFTDLDATKCFIKGRGNTTWEMNKKPYAVKLDSKAEILGMPKHKRWVLLANKIDKSMIRNLLTFMIARVCFDDGTGAQQGWNPSGHSVELVLNGIHQGNYLLCEQIKIDSKRINISEADDPINATSNQGYLLEGDRYWGGDPTENLYWISYRDTTSYRQQFNENFTHTYGTNYLDGGAQAKNGPYKFKWGLKGPDDGDLGENGVGRNTPAYKFIKGKVCDTEHFIFDTLTARTPLSDIAKYIHVDSFIDYWFVFEMAMNQEPNNPGSCYMHYSDKDGLLHAGPIWDFDWGTYNYSFTDGLYTNKADHFIVANSLWYCRLLQNTAFRQRVQQRWNIVAPKLTTLLNDTDMKRLADYVNKSAEYNFKIWDVVAGGHGDVNGENSMAPDAAAKRVTDNAKARISDLNDLIGNNRYN